MDASGAPLASKPGGIARRASGARAAVCLHGALARSASAGPAVAGPQLTKELLRGFALRSVARAAAEPEARARSTSRVTALRIVRSALRPGGREPQRGSRGARSCARRGADIRQG